MEYFRPSFINWKTQASVDELTGSDTETSESPLSDTQTSTEDSIIVLEIPDEYLVIENAIGDSENIPDPAGSSDLAQPILGASQPEGSSTIVPVGFHFGNMLNLF